MLPWKGISDIYRISLPRLVWPSPELSGKNHLWMPLQGDVEGPLDTNRQYLYMLFQQPETKQPKLFTVFASTFRA